MQATRLLRYGLFFTALYWSWAYVFAFIYWLVPLFIIFFYAGVLAILYLLTAMFFSQVEPTFWRGATLGAALMLTMTSLDSTQRVIADAVALLSVDIGVWYYALSTGIKELASDVDLGATAISAVVVGLCAILPQTALIARRMAPQARSY